MKMKINRFMDNPLVTPSDVSPFHDGYEVIGAFNAGVARYLDETLMLLRVAERPLSNDKNIVKAPYVNLKNGKVETKEFRKDDVRFDFSDPRMIKSAGYPETTIYLTSLSYIRIARSKNGIDFVVDDKPFLYPFNKYQVFGIEDARCTQIGNEYYISYTSVSPLGICDSLIKTKDFMEYDDLGNAFAPENKDVLLFPEKIKGSYYALHRPALKSIGNYDIWIASSPDLECWGHHKHLLGIREGLWDSGRIGGGLVPIKTKKGWLVIYHGATPENYYCMGAALLALDDPTEIIARSKMPIMRPDFPYEQNGFFGDVVFGCGGIVEGDTLTMYYGVADTSMAGCTMKISDILLKLEEG